MLDLITAVGIGVITGGALGAFSSYLGWNASGEPFARKRFISAVSTGVIAGVALVYMNLAGFKTAIGDDSGLAFIELLGTIALGTLGVDFFRSKLITILANKEPSTAVAAERELKV